MRRGQGNASECTSWRSVARTFDVFGHLMLRQPNHML